MPFLLLHVVCSFLLDLAHVLTRSDHTKDMELLLLRQQLRLYERETMRQSLGQQPLAPATSSPASPAAPERVRCRPVLARLNWHDHPATWTMPAPVCPAGAPRSASGDVNGPPTFRPRCTLGRRRVADGERAGATGRERSRRDVATATPGPPTPIRTPTADSCTDRRARRGTRCARMAA